MSVRAKFYVRGITRWNSGGSVELQAVVRGNENKSWCSATPSGQLTMSILNESALQVFEDALNRGRAGEIKPEFYLDFTPAFEADSPEA
jgi:hypothetical protein